MKQLLFLFLGFILGATVMYVIVENRQTPEEKALEMVENITESIINEVNGETEDVQEQTETTVTSNKVAQSGKNFKMFEKPGNSVGGSYFQVEKVMDEHYAIAQEQDYYDYTDTYLSKDLIVLFYSPEENAFYNEQIIKIPKGKCARQIGLYNWKEYTCSDGKMIPIVQIMNK